MNWWLTFAGLIVGVVVGMTGMGGGALMTPILVIFFGIQPLAAVSSDLVAAAIMKPVGSVVHLRRGTVNLALVKWLCIGSVPCAFAGVFVAKAIGPGARVNDVIQFVLGIALLVASASLIVKAYLSMLERARRRADGVSDDTDYTAAPVVDVHILRTVAIGAIGGLLVGMTSVGSGSLIIIALIAVYPRLQPSSLVGTDLVQAVPLVASAALAHVLFGDFHLGITVSLLIGCLPGVYLGATLSSRVPGGIIRRALAFVLLASGLKLLDFSNFTTVVILVVVVVVGPPVWMWLRHRHGFPPLASQEQAGDDRPDTVELPAGSDPGDRRPES
ncbi:MAG TPA: sulfite exporter TauE/SafE family protein [Mycobacteriales bacterium]